jgi:predicted small secreted protein
MKKIAIILAWMLVCFSLFTGCTNQKNGDDQDTNMGNSVEFDDTDIDVDTETKPDAEDNADSVSLPDGYTYSFKDPDNADGIVVTPKA